MEIRAQLISENPVLVINLIHLIGGGPMSFNRNLGLLLLGIYLILIGLSAFVSLGNLGTVLAILALASGVLIVINR